MLCGEEPIKPFKQGWKQWGGDKGGKKENIRKYKEHIGISSLYCQDSQSLLLGLVISTVRLRILQRQNCIFPKIVKNLAKNLVKNLPKIFPPCLPGPNFRTSSAKNPLFPPLKIDDLRSNLQRHRYALLAKQTLQSYLNQILIRFQQASIG